MKKNKTATITFHASHNYGSMLQAFALQQTLIKNGYENTILNFRTFRQKDLYTVLTKRKGVKYVLKNVTHLLWYADLYRRYIRFEEFLNKNLRCSGTEYATCGDLEKDDLIYDFYISGSDQIWNPIPADFDWAYYLPFVKNGKCISYATSFGQLASHGDNETKRKISECLKKYDSISVREVAAKRNVESLSGRQAELVIDPTLLLSGKEWDELLPTEKRSEDYIFFYTLFATPEYMRIVKKISKMTGLRVVVSNFSNQYDLFNPFKKEYDAGPIEFLQLVREAKLVITTSFHGTAFSILFNRPFFAINGKTDARINTILALTGLQNRALEENEINEKWGNILEVDFTQANIALEAERKKSKEWLFATLS